MTGPDRIWVTQEDHGASWSGSFRAFRASDLDHGDDYPEYIRRDPAVLAELPEVQALIRQAVEIVHVQAFVEGRDAGIAAEREACATLMDRSHFYHMARKGRDPARYSSVWSVAAAAIRKRGDHQ